MHDASIIPEDLESCRDLLQQAWALQAELTDTCNTLQGQEEKLRQDNEQLQVTIQHLLRQLYGRRSERFIEGQGQQHLDFGDDASDPSIVSAAHDDPVIQEVLVRRRQGRKRRSEKLPDHLERRIERIEPKLPPGIRLEDCGLIGVDVVEVLEFQRGKLCVRRFEYPKYKLPSSVGAFQPEAQPLVATEPVLAVEPVLATEPVIENEIIVATEPVQLAEPVVDAAPLGDAAGDRQPLQELPAETSDSSSPEVPPVVDPAPAVATTVAVVTTIAVNSAGIIQAPRVITLVEGGHFGFSVAAEVLFQKFGLHVPFYRQQDSLAQLGWSPNRSTLGLIVTNSAELFGSLADLLRQRVLARDNLGTDDTPVTLLTPREGDGSREARFWLYRGREGAPYDVFAFTDSRRRDGPDSFLESFRGILSGDCYSGYVNIEKVTQGRIRFSACLNHARRYVFNAREQQPILGSQMLAQFRLLYDIEDRARTMEPAARQELRQRESVPVMKRLRELLDSEAAKRVLPKSKFGEALGYLGNHWPAFQVYLEDGRIPIDNNDVERDLRRIAIGRNNWLFVGSQAAGERAATILTIMASAHRHDLDVWAYVSDALEKLAHGRAAAGGDVHKIDPAILESLLPDVWAKSHPESIRTFRVNEKEQRAANRRFKRAERRRTRGRG